MKICFWEFEAVCCSIKEEVQNFRHLCRHCGVICVLEKTKRFSIKSVYRYLIGNEALCHKFWTWSRGKIVLFIYLFIVLNHYLGFNLTNRLWITKLCALRQTNETKSFIFLFISKKKLFVCVKKKFGNKSGPSVEQQRCIFFYLKYS